MHVATGPQSDTSVATRDGKHRTQIYNSYLFWVECSCGWKSRNCGSHSLAKTEAQTHRAAQEKAA